MPFDMKQKGSAAKKPDCSLPSTVDPHLLITGILKLNKPLTRITIIDYDFRYDD